MTADRSPLAAALAEALPTTIGAAFIRRKLGSPNSAFWERDANALLGHPAVVAALAQRDRDAVREWLTVERVWEAAYRLNGLVRARWDATGDLIAPADIRAALLADSPPADSEEDGE